MLKELPTIGVSGEYRFQLSKAEKSPHTDTGFFKNLILDNGLNMICNIAKTSTTSNNNAFLLPAAGPLSYCYVGSGGATPTYTNTQLQNRIGSTDPAQESKSGTSSFSRGYAELVVVYRFNAGTVVGNLSEVGIGPSPTSLFSRALILDSNGDPTTITVLDDDILTVTYRLRLTIPRVDILQSINVDNSGVDIPTTVTIRPFASNSYSLSGTTTTHGFTWGIKRSFGNGTSSVATGTSTDLVSATDTTLSSHVLPSSVALDSYVNNSFRRTGYATFSTTQSNRDIAVFAYSFGPGCFQVKFDPPLQKTNQMALRLSFGFQVARA